MKFSEVKYRFKIQWTSEKKFKDKNGISVETNPMKFSFHKAYLTLLFCIMPIAKLIVGAI